MSCSMYLADSYPSFHSAASEHSTLTLEDHLRLDSLSSKWMPSESIDALHKELSRTLKNEPESPSLKGGWRLPDHDHFLNLGAWAASPTVPVTVPMAEDTGKSEGLPASMTNHWSPMHSQEPLQSRSASLPELDSPRSQGHENDEDACQSLGHRSVSLPQSGAKDTKSLEELRQKRRKCNRESARRVKARREKQMNEMKEAVMKLTNEKKVLMQELDRVYKDNLKLQNGVPHIVNRCKTIVLENMRLKRQLQLNGSNSVPHPVTPPVSASRQNFRSLSLNAVTAPAVSYTPPPTSGSLPHCPSFDSLHLQSLGNGNSLSSFLDASTDPLLATDNNDDLTDMGSLLNGLNW